jgi:hypothetical protein
MMAHTNNEGMVRKGLLAGYDVTPGQIGAKPTHDHKITELFASSRSEPLGVACSL